MVFHRYEFFHMSSNAVIDWASFHTLSGWIVFISMNSSMCLQIVWTTELLFTLWAAECFFISMNSFMWYEILNDWTSFRTLSDWMGFYQHEIFYVSSNCMNTWTSFHTLSSWMVLHQYEYFHVSSNAVIDFTVHKIFFVVHGGSTTEFVPELKKRYFINIQLYMRACSWKRVECEEQRCYQMCDKSALYMYFKKLGFSGFSHPVEPEIRIVLH